MDQGVESRQVLGHAAAGVAGGGATMNQERPVRGLGEQQGSGGGGKSGGIRVAKSRQAVGGLVQAGVNPLGVGIEPETVMPPRAPSGSEGLGGGEWAVREPGGWRGEFHPGVGVGGAKNGFQPNHAFVPPVAEQFGVVGGQANRSVPGHPGDEILGIALRPLTPGDGIVVTAANRAVFQASGAGASEGGDERLQCRGGALVTNVGVEIPVRWMGGIALARAPHPFGGGGIPRQRRHAVGATGGVGHAGGKGVVIEAKIRQPVVRQNFLDSGVIPAFR